MRMFKIDIQTDDGRMLEMSKDLFIYYQDAGGKDTYWEWEQFRGRAAQFDPIFAQARALVDKTEERLPDLPIPGMR